MINYQIDRDAVNHYEELLDEFLNCPDDKVMDYLKSGKMKELDKAQDKVMDICKEILSLL